MNQAGARDPRSLIALGITVLATVGMVIAVPSLLPGPVRDLVGLSPERVAEAPSVPDVGTHAFLVHQEGDTAAPVGYDPCKRVKVKINPEQAPPGGVAMVRTAMTDIERLTGLRFDYQGTTDQRPRWESETVPVFLGQARTQPALISWATEDEVPQLAGRVAGVGGSLPVPNNGGYLRYVTGGVTLDSAVFAVLDKTAGGRAEARAIILHELGHLVGLGHVNDPGELMNADNVGLLDFGPGDRFGLAQVGSTKCG